MGELYEADVLEWSEHQARLLRQHAAGERLDETPDWPNIAEEIEAAGRSERHAVERDGSGNLDRCAEWSSCLTAAKMAAEQEQR